eukprot:1899246-Ditylum_brightwellii.AAC.1
MRLSSHLSIPNSDLSSLPVSYKVQGKPVLSKKILSPVTSICIQLLLRAILISRSKTTIPGMNKSQLNADVSDDTERIQVMKAYSSPLYFLPNSMWPGQPHCQWLCTSVWFWSWSFTLWQSWSQ